MHICRCRSKHVIYVLVAHIRDNSIWYIRHKYRIVSILTCIRLIHRSILSDTDYGEFLRLFTDSGFKRFSDSLFIPKQCNCSSLAYNAHIITFINIIAGKIAPVHNLISGGKTLHITYSGEKQSVRIFFPVSRSNHIYTRPKTIDRTHAALDSGHIFRRKALIGLALINRYIYRQNIHVFKLPVGGSLKTVSDNEDRKYRRYTYYDSKHRKKRSSLIISYACNRTF